MRAALNNSYLDYVLYMGITEKYPKWFTDEVGDDVYTDEHRYTFYIPKNERNTDYYDRILVEDYSVFLRKSNGDIFVTDYDVFSEMYNTFRYDSFTNSGLAAFKDDCIEYVECQGGVVTADYPDWFYEFFTEAINFPPNDETILVSSNGEVSVDSRSVFLRNKFGEIKGMLYGDFIKYYDPDGVFHG